MISHFAVKNKLLRFSTEYLKSASQYIKSKPSYKKFFGDTEPTIITPWSRTGNNKSVEIFLSFGATEAKPPEDVEAIFEDRKSTRLNSSHANISYAVFCLKKNHTR